MRASQQAGTPLSRLINDQIQFRRARTDEPCSVVSYNEVVVVVVGWRIPGVLIITYRKLHLSLIVPHRPVMAASPSAPHTNQNIASFVIKILFLQKYFG